MDKIIPTRTATKSFSEWGKIKLAETFMHYMNGPKSGYYASTQTSARSWELEDQTERKSYTLKKGITPMEYVETEKDIGVIIDTKLSFEQHMCEKINKSNSIMGYQLV